MRTTTRRMRFTVERSETLLVRPTQLAVSCTVCGRDAQMLAPDAAAVIAGVSIRTIYQMLEAGEIHFVESKYGRLLICLDSLSQKEEVENEENDTNCSDSLLLP